MLQNEETTVPRATGSNPLRILFIQSVVSSFALRAEPMRLMALWQILPVPVWWEGYETPTYLLPSLKNLPSTTEAENVKFSIFQSSLQLKLGHCIINSLFGLL